MSRDPDYTPIWNQRPLPGFTKVPALGADGDGAHLSADREEVRVGVRHLLLPFQSRIARELWAARSEPARTMDDSRATILKAHLSTQARTSVVGSIDLRNTKGR